MSCVIIGRSERVAGLIEEITTATCFVVMFRSATSTDAMCSVKLIENPSIVLTDL